MKEKIITIMFLSAVVLTAQPGRGYGYYGWSNQLNLTTEQIQQINELRTQYLKDRMNSQTEVASLRLDLRQLMSTDEPNQRLIDAKLARIQTMEADLEQLWVQHRLNIRAQLTDEQQINFDSRSMIGRGGYGRGGYGRGGGGMRLRDGTGPYCRWY